MWSKICISNFLEIISLFFPHIFKLYVNVFIFFYCIKKKKWYCGGSSERESMACNVVTITKLSWGFHDCNMNLIMSFPRFDILKAFDCSVLQLISNSNANINREWVSERERDGGLFSDETLSFYCSRLEWVNEGPILQFMASRPVMLMQISLFSLSIYLSLAVQ